MRETFIRLFRYKAWANDELLRNLATLPDDSGVAILATKALSHSHVVDRIFAAHLRRKSHSYHSTNPDSLPTMSKLSAEVRESDQEYLDYVSTLSVDQLSERMEFRFTDGARGCMSREEILLHIVTHGVGHRGQINALMMLNAMTPANDGLTTYLHSAEAEARGRGRKPFW